jgi:mono/diheme cytochrome c family protein
VSKAGLISRWHSGPAAAAAGLVLGVCTITIVIAGRPAGVAGAEAVTPVAEVLSVPPAAKAIELRYETQVKPLLTKYCSDCHMDGMDKGDIDLDPFASLESVQTAKQTWQRVADAVQHKAMPPEKKDQPTDDERKLLTAWVREALEFCDCSGPRDPGRVTIRRLNRNEYNNTIRDLLGVTDFKPAADFPADDSGYGFDHIGDVLTMSPLLVEKYLAAAEQVLDGALGTGDQKPGESPVAKFDGGELRGHGGGSPRRFASEGEASRRVEIARQGRYEIRVEAAADQAGGEPARMALKVEGRELKVFDVDNDAGAPKRFDAQVELPPGRHRVTTAFVNDYYNPQATDGRRDRNLIVHKVEVVGPLDAPPPGPTDGQKRILFAVPGQDGMSDEQAAARVIERFAATAYRRPVTAEEVAKLTGLYRMARSEGDDYVKAVKFAMSAVLVSPNFLFRVEQERDADPAKPYPVGDYELASRLSYFLWSSMPDDALFATAASGRLREPQTLRAELRRMLADPKASALVSNFVGQWLELRNLDTLSIERRVFNEFKDELRGDMRREAEMFFESLIRDDRPVLDLLNADYTFLNGRLARHYGINGVEGDEFRRVSLAGTRRGGVLTMGGVLMVTAMPTRTSPVKRGKFVLEQMLASPPPPAPPDVSALSDGREERRRGSVRQRFEAHRSDATCVACHARMDPIGFAMENFDATGRWRDKDGDFAIDASGALPEGEKFNGPDELRAVLVGRKGEFVKAFVEKMLTYALGRGMELHDRCTVRDIAAAVEKDGYKFSTLLEQVVMSDAFQKRRAKRPDEVR